MNYHQPVLLSEVIKLLDPQSGQTFLDATLGHAGHTLEILNKGATVYGLDLDPQNQKIAVDRIKNENLSTNFHPLKGNFSQIYSLWHKKIKQPLDGLLVDLGLSLNQQSGTDRGFSFNDPKSLDMRLNPKTQTLSAEEIINTWDKDQLYEIFTKYAQEKLAKPLVYEIIQARQHHPIKNGLELSQIVQNYYQKKHYSTQKNPSTKIFLALRITVNHEFDNLKKLLNASLKITKKSGKVVIISFHSGEDRIIKQFIVQHHLKSEKFLPTHQEIKKNPLSRSAVLRIYQNN
ncbi:MAG: 16S rRNA (cytosine(1402)-N(4))-methyltransferase RsmH [Candidatus Shapirobacteria bacterium]|jgi:16S rRNA (cytosine1402-N4)-methyltransferase